jgi:hypothetical protein
VHEEAVQMYLRELARVPPLRHATRVAKRRHPNPRIVTPSEAAAPSRGARPFEPASAGGTRFVSGHAGTCPERVEGGVPNHRFISFCGFS